jgi:hypothetical protein
MGDFKDKNGESRVGKLLRDIGKSHLIDKASLMVQQGASGNWLGAISTLFKKETDVTPAQQERFDSAYEMDLKDRQDARAMQVAIATSKESTTLAKNFVYYIASFWSLVTALYIFFITFSDVKNQRAADTVLGFLLGTIIATIINYFFGSSKGSKDKLNHIFNTKK